MREKFIRNIHGLLLLTVLVCFCAGITSCRDDQLTVASDPVTVGDEIRFSGSLSIPGMRETVTRGVPGDMAGADLILTVLEFDLGSSAANSFLTNVYNVAISDATNVQDMTEVRFNLTVRTSATPKVLHFLLTDEPVNASSGSVASILPTLVNRSSGGESYWGYREFPEGLTRPGADEGATPELRDDVVSLLQKIPMIRNFAKISVEVDIDAGSADGFILNGFDLVNIPQYGTVAPWNETSLSVPDLLEKDAEGETVNKMLGYTSLNYKGFTPGSVMFENTEVEAKRWDSSNPYFQQNVSRYVYEHPYESTRRTYLIICGRFVRNGVPQNVSYYKVDLGYHDPNNNNVFRYYNIIRNLHYKVKITKVAGDGMTTVAQAIDRAPYNNISASTETSDMLQISDNRNLLMVDNNRFIITAKGEELTILYRYLKDIDQPAETGGRKPANDVVKFVDLEPGNVISEITEGYPDQVFDVGPDGEEWGVLKILCKDPTNISRRQSFTIVDGNGLGRTINLILRNPWRYAYLRDEQGNLTNVRATVAPGSDNTYPFGSSGTYPETPVVSNKANKALTVYFDLPADMDEAMFPLEFRLESRYQGIENNKVGNLVVTTGPSLFDPEEITISYIKRVSLEEYMYMYDDDNNLNVNEPNNNHTIRCRFLTINEVEEGSEAEIRIHNPYFDPDITVQFKREDIPDPE